MEESDENDKFVPDEQQIQLLIGYAWLHDKTDCFSTNPKPTTKYTRPANPTPSYPFAFPVQSVCLIYQTMDGEAGKFRFNSTGKNYTQSDLSDIGEYPVNTTFSTGPKGRELFLVNGQIKPVIPMESNKWYQLRMVNTVMNYLLFWVRDDNVTQNCNVYVMGRDGVYFNETRPRNIQNPPYRNRTIVIPPCLSILTPENMHETQWLPLYYIVHDRWNLYFIVV